jgi:threonine/homoserine/homoserine lactone efflux protein
MVLSLLIGFAFGYFGSMPVAGPISLLVLHLGLEGDVRHGFYVAMGGALAEGLYALLAFWGLSTAMDRFPVILPVSRLVGAAILLGLGLVLLLRKPRERDPAGPRRKGTKRSFIAGFLITAVNPTLLVTWTAAVAALHGTGLLRMSQGQAVPFALAVSLGIVAWFATLLAVVARFQGLWTPAGLNRFMRAMGALLVAIGAWMATRALANLFR